MYSMRHINHKDRVHMIMYRNPILLGSILVIASFVFLFLTFADMKTEHENLMKYLEGTTYVIDGELITLVQGKAETPTTLSRPKTIIHYFGNETVSDLNGDGLKDIIFLLKQVTARGEEFYYIAAALNTGERYVGTNIIFLGDRIAPQTTESKDREVLVNFATRKSNEPLTVNPSVPISKYFIVRNNMLTEIVK
jgi:hypothetical protein